PGAFGNGAKAVPSAAPHAFGAAGAAPSSARGELSDRHWDALWLLGARAFCCRVPGAVRRVSVSHASSALRIASASVCRNCIARRKIGQLGLRLGQALPGHLNQSGDCAMKIDLTAAARIVPLTALMLGACVSQSAYEKQGAELQQARAQA